MSVFSIIIAVKNKEKYIGNTIKSCLNQTLNSDKFEILIINDNSNDNTLKIVKNFSKKNKNIKFVNNTKTYGPGITRNIALVNAKNKYIIFLDGDDLLKKNCLIELSKFTYKNPDLITFDFDKKKKNKIFKNQRKDFKKITQNKKLMISNFIRGEIDGSVIFTCFKKSFLKKNNIKFPKGLHEDIIYIFKSYFYSKKIIFIKKSLYKKNEVSNSITGTISKQRIENLLDIHKKILYFLKAKKIFFYKLNEDAFRGFVGYVADTILEISKSKILKKHQKNYLLKVVKYKISKFAKPKKYIFLTKKDIFFKNYIN